MKSKGFVFQIRFLIANIMDGRAVFFHLFINSFDNLTHLDNHSSTESLLSSFLTLLSKSHLLFPSLDE